MSSPSSYDCLHLPWHGFIEGFQVSGSDAVPDPRPNFSEHSRLCQWLTAFLIRHNFHQWGLVFPDSTYLNELNETKK